MKLIHPKLTQIKDIFHFDIVFSDKLFRSLTFLAFAQQHFNYMQILLGQIQILNASNIVTYNCRISLQMIQTCKLQMNASSRIIFLLIFAACFRISFNQDSTQIRSAPDHPQPASTPLSSVPQLAQLNSSTIYSFQNASKTPDSSASEVQHPIIITNQVLFPKNPNSKQRHQDMQVSHEKLQSAEPEQHTEHHDSQEHHDDQQMTHQDIHKMLSQMANQQLKAFQDSLQGQALGYYNQIKAEQLQHEHQQQLQYEQQYEQIEGELTKTKKEQAIQQQQFQKEHQQISNQLIEFNQYLFQLDSQKTQDFRFSIPNAQKIIFYGLTYQNIDGFYKVTDEVQEQQPLRLYIFENKHKLVYQKQFYFKYFGPFMGNQSCTYLFRFLNPSARKLIGLNIGFLFQLGHAEDKLTTSDLSSHSRRIQTFNHDISTRYRAVSVRTTFQHHNRQNLSNKLDRYYVFSFVQIAILLVLCLLQVEFAKKLLFNNPNIV